MSHGYRPGDGVDLHEPPEHCGTPMTLYRGSRSAFELVCGHCNAEIRTDEDGVVIR
ncbi:hypothetical protein [Streptomyces fuscigenes]|uniref:hypothetical protein n=1 Tax=Streptomyces fuscigenes TaxID=1528880 RepID=UPI001F27F15C|nr:hypothetical protein [Streptomyces fuscigenes]MCF3960289.1 hypothetical protein [Streptomyces fuscigenes]